MLLRREPRFFRLLFGVLLLLPGCATREEPPLRLVLISPHRDEIREEVGIAFPEWYAERCRQRGEPVQRVECVWQDVGGGTSQIARYVRARFQASSTGIGVDLLYGGGTDIYIRFADEGLLAPLELPRTLLQDRIRPDLNGVPLYDAKGRWFGAMLSSFGILCNQEVLRRIGHPALPQSWDDLGDRRLRSWVGAGDPRQAGSVHMVYEIILQGEGWDRGFPRLLRLGANAHSFIRDSGTLTRVVVTGDVAAAGNVDVNALSAVGRHPDVMAFLLPAGKREVLPDGKMRQTGGTIINPDAVAVLKGAPHPEVARAFVEYSLSDAGQKLFFLRPGLPGGPRRHPLCRLSIVEWLYAQFPVAERSTGEANPFAQTDTLQYNASLGNRRWDALNDLIGAVIVDAHDDLSAAWAAVAALPEDAAKPLEAKLFALPCTEAELMAHAKRIVEGSPRDRAAQVNQWGEEARQRYRQVRQESRR